MKYFVNNSTRIDGAPESVLYDTLGNLVMKLETPDLKPLMDAGFKFPEPFTVKADDGVTDLYGVMYKPFDFDPARKYPIIAYVYPGPQTEGRDQELQPAQQQHRARAVRIHRGRGRQPRRPPDALEVVPQLRLRQPARLRPRRQEDRDRAARRAGITFIDINKVGIWGHSGGGFMSAAAMLVYPDFFKVGWSESGNHENNIYNNTWSEKHHGIKEVEKDGKVTFEYNIDKNSELAKNLKGNLMLITG